MASSQSLVFYTVSNKYIQFLKGIDRRVLDNYDETRPYVGVVCRIGDHDYLAPLTSDKQKKYINFPDSKPTIVKVYKSSSCEASNYTGAVLLNNMIPVLWSEASRMDFNGRGVKYQNLLNQQHKYLRKRFKRDEIAAKAQKLYRWVVQDRTEFYRQICCDFQALESAYRKYSPSVRGQKL
jgi:protein AbiQ